MSRSKMRPCTFVQHPKSGNTLMMAPLCNIQEQKSLLSFDQQTIHATQERRNQHLQDPSRMSTLFSKAMSCLIFPASCCLGWVQVTPNTDAIILRYGQPIEILRETGSYYFSPIGLDVQHVWVGNRNVSLNLQVNDLLGNPITVEAQYNYHVVNALSATLCVKDHREFICYRAKEVVRQIFSQYSHQIAPSQIGELSLRIKHALQQRVEKIGLEVNSFTVTLFQYQQSLQTALLAKQQAQSYVASCKAIVQKGLDVTEKTAQRLKRQKLELTPAELSALAQNIITIAGHETSLCFHSQPIQLNSLPITLLQKYK